MPYTDKEIKRMLASDDVDEFTRIAGVGEISSSEMFKIRAVDKAKTASALVSEKIRRLKEDPDDRDEISLMDPIEIENLYFETLESFQFYESVVTLSYLDEFGLDDRMRKLFLDRGLSVEKASELTEHFKSLLEKFKRRPSHLNPLTRAFNDAIVKHVGEFVKVLQMKQRADW